MTTELVQTSRALLQGDAAVVKQSDNSPANVFLDRFSPNNQTGTSYSLALADTGRLVTMTNASANTVTIPLDSTIPTDGIVMVACYGTGGTTVQAASGVTLNGLNGGGFALAGPAETVLLHKTAANTWKALNRTDVA